MGPTDRQRQTRARAISDAGKRSAVRQAAHQHVASLTVRQREIMQMVLAGHPSKNIAADLHISQRTVENHRASIMKRTGSKSLPDLARLALAAASINPRIAPLMTPLLSDIALVHWPANKA